VTIAEAQGAIIGDDLLIISGFTNGFSSATPACYARNLNNAGAVWRRMDDIPESKGLNHASVVVDGLKLYMCGGYVSFSFQKAATSAAAIL
jgi:N-acetylneuraminic acid mutarotase